MSNRAYPNGKPRRPDDCPAEDWLAFLGHRWNALTLWHLSAEPLRFGDLQARLPGITPKVLTERLAGLVARGLVTRCVTAAHPPRVHYALSDRGRQVGALVQGVYDWAAMDAAREGGRAEPGPDASGGLG